MYTLLVVDDEGIAVRGITKGIDWSELMINQIFEAFNVKQAMEIFSKNRIDLLICDIEMSGQNGIELLEWVKTQYTETETIFLTGHADFGYAQKALQLGSFDYVLKPVKHEHLKKIAEQALIQVKHSRDLREFNETYKLYYQQWETQLPFLIERFWQDLLHQRILPTNHYLVPTLEQLKIPLTIHDQILPILISVEMWKEEMTTRDEEIMEYALRKVASEIFFGKFSGVVIQDRNGINLILIYVKHNETVSPIELKQVCNEYIQACVRYFHCSLSCYVGEKTHLNNISKIHADLLEMERNNVFVSNTVLYNSDLALEKSVSVSSAPINPIIDWTFLFELGRKQELLDSIAEKCRDLELQKILRIEEIESLYSGVLYLLYTTFHKKGLSIYDAFQSKELIDPSLHIRSLLQFRTWSNKVIMVGIDYYHHHCKGESDIIVKAKKYIMDNLDKEFSREDIAAFVHLNSSYLSRFFKKETGTSLSDFILQERMNEAKRLLVETEMKISQIAESVGYMNFSHFTSMFKKVKGVTPQNYRKKEMKE